MHSPIFLGSGVLANGGEILFVNSFQCLNLLFIAAPLSRIALLFNLLDDPNVVSGEPLRRWKPGGTGFGGASRASQSVLTRYSNLWSTANNVMQMRPANAIPHGVANVRIIPGIRISGYNMRAGIGA
jgi:hypothetical protein